MLPMRIPIAATKARTMKSRGPSFSFFSFETSDCSSSSYAAFSAATSMPKSFGRKEIIITITRTPIGNATVYPRLIADEAAQCFSGNNMASCIQCCAVSGCGSHSTGKHTDGFKFSNRRTSLQNEMIRNQRDDHRNNRDHRTDDNKFDAIFLKIAPIPLPTFMPMETRNSIRKNVKNRLLTTPVLSTLVALE